MHTDTQVVTLIFTIVTGAGVLLQACVLLGMFFALKETQKKIHSLTEKIEVHVLPLVGTSRNLLEELTPQIKAIAANVVSASNTLKVQTESVKTVVEDVTTRTKIQTARADSMMTGALNSIANAGAAVERGIAAPLRQVSGILNGLRAGLDTLRVKESDGPKGSAYRVSVPGAPRTPLAPSAPTSTFSPLRSVVPAADTATPLDSEVLDGLSSHPVSTPEGRSAAAGATTTAEDVTAAAAKFIRERAGAATNDRR